MPPRKKKVAPASVGLSADEVAAINPPGEVQDLAERVNRDGGQVLTQYREPLGGRWLMLVALPIEKIFATPYQRELSETHVKRLVDVIPKVGRFLDPIIA